MPYSDPIKGKKRHKEWKTNNKHYVSKYNSLWVKYKNYKQKAKDNTIFLRDFLLKEFLYKDHTEQEREDFKLLSMKELVLKVDEKKLKLREIKKIESKINEKLYTRRYRQKKMRISLDYIWSYKSQQSCTCGESHPAALSFHHRDPAKKSGYISAFCNKSFQRLKEEIDKCDIKCFNCHHKEHYHYDPFDNLSSVKIDPKKRQIIKNRKIIVLYKKSNPCEICGESDYRVLSFHHVNPSEKEKEVSRMVKKGTKKLLAEIAKCQVLCANCHQKLHYDLKQKLKVT